MGFASPETPAQRSKCSRSRVTEPEAAPPAVPAVEAPQVPVNQPASRQSPATSIQASGTLQAPIDAVLNEFAQRRLYDGARAGRLKEVKLALERDGAQ